MVWLVCLECVVCGVVCVSGVCGVACVSGVCGVACVSGGCGVVVRIHAVTRYYLRMYVCMCTLFCGVCVLLVQTYCVCTYVCVCMYVCFSSLLLRVLV